jgi:hypothetical protein
MNSDVPIHYVHHCTYVKLLFKSATVIKNRIESTKCNLFYVLYFMQMWSEWSSVLFKIRKQNEHTKVLVFCNLNFKEQNLQILKTSARKASFRNRVGCII